MSIPTLTDPPSDPMTEARPARVPVPAVTATPVLDVVIPVYNEEDDLAPCVRRLHAYLTEHLPYPFRITIADNASVDATPLMANALAAEMDG